MNFKKIGLALAVTAAASSANAELFLASNDAGNDGGSSLLFAAYDAAAAKTLFVDLGTRVHTFDANAQYDYNFSAIASANGIDLSDVQWTVVSADNQNLGGTCGPADFGACGQTFMATVSTGETPEAGYISNDISQAANTTNNGWFIDTRGAMLTAGTDYAVTPDGQPADWISGVLSAATLWDVTGTTGESLAFAMSSTIANGVGRTGAAVFADDSVTSFANPLATWTLTADGSLSYSAVPVPAAVWMFASGLVGMAGVARRRKQA